MKILEEEPQLEVKSRLPWIIDIFLYPLNLAGIIHLICLWLLVFLLCPLVMQFLGLGIEYIPIVYTLPIAYVLYYFAECIRDSAIGRCRAPDFWMHPAKSDKWDCISQSLVVLGCIAVCFWPVAIYYGFTQRIDSTFWLLSACGAFFFPMALLAGVLFDAIHALNPIFIIGSILRTFFAYCGLILLFCLFDGLVAVIIRTMHRLPILGFISNAVNLYLLFVAAHLLGRFYWRNKDKFDWGI